MILLEDTPVKYRDGTVKTLDELGGEAKELAPDTPVVSGGSSKPLDEFIQDQIVLSPDTVVVDGEDTTTLEDFVEEEIDANTGVVHKTGSETITGTKTFKEEVRVHTQTGLSEYMTKYESDAIESNAQVFTFTGQQKLTVDSDMEVDGDLEVTGGIKVSNCTNLEEYFNAMSTMTVAWVYSQTAQDAPSTQMSWTLMMKSDNANYGYMFWFGLGAIYCRFLNNGTWGNWAQC